MGSSIGANAEAHFCRLLQFGKDGRNKIRAASHNAIVRKRSSSLACVRRHHAKSGETHSFQSFNIWSLFETKLTLFSIFQGTMEEGQPRTL